MAQDPPGHIPGFRLPGTMIPIGAVYGSPRWPAPPADHLKQKKEYREAMEAHATSLRKRIRFLAQQLTLVKVPSTTRKRPVSQVEKFMRGYETEYELLEPAWPVITANYSRATTDPRPSERLLGVTERGNVVPMELSGSWYDHRCIPHEPADAEVNRGVITRQYPDGRPLASAIIMILEDLARGAGMTLTPWEPAPRPRSLPVSLYGYGGDSDDWILRDE